MIGGNGFGTRMTGQAFALEAERAFGAISLVRAEAGAGLVLSVATDVRGGASLVIKKALPMPMTARRARREYCRFIISEKRYS